jgi:hypothetical protein
VLRLICHIIVTRSLSWNICQSNLSLLVSLKCLPINQSVPQCVIKSFRLLQWFRLWSASVWHQIIYNLEWLHMHLMHLVLLELTVAMSLYKDMSSYNASSHFSHTLSTPSHTIDGLMPRYLIPAWNEHPFCHCRQRAKLSTSLEPSTYVRSCWVCPDTNPSGTVCLAIFIF